MVNYYDFVKAHPEYFKQFSSKELLFLICECPPEFTQSEDWSDFNCFVYGLDGDHFMHSRDRYWHVSHGSSIFMKKGGCSIRKGKQASFCCMIFYVPDSYIRKFTRENIALFTNCQEGSVTQDLVIPIATDKVLEGFYESVIPYFTTDVKPSEDLVELKFRELLINVVSNNSNKDLNAYFHKLSLSETDDIRDVMERNYRYNLQLQEYARLCHRSLSSFKRDFQAVFHMAPGRWLLEKRLEAANQLLLTSQKSIVDVAMESGFKNTAHFSRAFKLHFGVSPLKRRHQVAAEI
jgi:AraC family transcriptional regulator, exoenzyme S synthesis regulatory protein ExsA